MPFSIRNCTKKRYKALYEKIQQQVWDIYQAVDRQNFFRQVVDLQLWASRIDLTRSGCRPELCAKADTFALAFDYPNAYRTSNMIDRHMIPLDRSLSASRYFHGHWSSLNCKFSPVSSFMTSCPSVPEPKSPNEPSHLFINSTASSITILASQPAHFTSCAV